MADTFTQGLVDKGEKMGLIKGEKARLSPSGPRVPVLHYHTRIFLIHLISQYYNILITKH